MKKYLLLTLSTFLLTLSYAQKDPILMYVDGKPVYKSEFLQIYLKNNPNPKYDKASLDEYLELFTKFKLKVAEAERLGYDTIPKLNNELEGYRKQLSTPYMIDSAKNDQLVREAYNRTLKERRASHILVKVDPNATPSDTLSAWNRIMGLKKRIDGGEDFATVARTKSGSDDPSARENGGDLGYFAAFQMVYPFEDAAYITPVGKVSNPVRTKFGYHIIKVVDERDARGSIQTSHLMVAVKKDAPKEEMEAAERKINDIYTELQQGAKWEDMVNKYSDDPTSMSKGGMLPVFGTGASTRMVPEFEDAAFKISKDGDISKPIQTDYGFHIIKRIEKFDVKSFDELKKELQNKVNRDERSKKNQNSFIAKLKKEYKYKNTASAGLKFFKNDLDSTYFEGKYTGSRLKTNTTLFTLNGKNYTQKDYLDYLTANYRMSKKSDISLFVDKSYLEFENAKILEYEESQLTKKYPAYKALMQEYHDGILLYEVMTDEVWNKALKDTSGLRTYFNLNREKYMFGQRYDALVYETYKPEIAEEVYKMIQNDTINSRHVIEKVNKESELNLTVRTNKFEMENTPFLKDQNLKPGINDPYLYDGKYYVVKVTEKLEPMPKELTETKGAVTSDYQNELEKQWLFEIAERHTVKIDKDVLYSLGK